MIIAFCGHRDFSKTEEYERKIIAFFEEKIGDKTAEMYLGGYGGFDEFAYECCNKYKRSHPNIRIVFVTPYMTLEYQRNHLEYQKMRYDYILYPEIENRPSRFAIIYRNKYMVDKADYVVAYVKHNRGGAYKSYEHAKRKGKEIFNLADFE